MGDIPIAGTWRMSAPPSDVYAVVADLSTWSAWWPAIRTVEPLGGGDPAAPDAARLNFDTPAPLRSLVVELEVVERDPPARLVIVPRRGPLDGTGRLEVHADGDGSAVEFDLRLRVRSLLLKPLEVVLAGTTRAGRERLRRAGDDLAVLAGGEPGEHDV